MKIVTPCFQMVLCPRILKLIKYKCLLSDKEQLKDRCMAKIPSIEYK